MAQTPRSAQSRRAPMTPTRAPTIALAPRPMMNAPEVEALRAVLQEYRPTRVLEWGAGGSTLYWPREFPDIDWHTIEHDQRYYDAVSAQRLAPNASMLRLDFPEYYAAAPALGMFDLIIVDGRERVHCASVARYMLNEGGVVLVHDFTRERYKSLFTFYNHSVVLVPPTASKDPRGLVLLSAPVSTPPAPERLASVLARPTPTAAPRGVVYVCFGAPASAQADSSIRSLSRVAPGLPVLVVGDGDAVQHFAGRAGVDVVTPNVDPFKSASLFGFHAGRIKPLLAALSPFEETLYVDADTEFKVSPTVGFDMLARWDVVVAEAEIRSLAVVFPDNTTEASDTARWLGTPHILYHNSGMIFWRRNESTLRLFELWSEEWQKYRGWDEQVALLRALLLSDVLFLNVPFTWNCRGPQQSFLVYHRFASKAARKFSNFRANGGARGVPMVQAVQFVQVEVTPGRFVKARLGEEDKVREHFRALLRERK